MSTSDNPTPNDAHKNLGPEDDPVVLEAILGKKERQPPVEHGGQDVCRICRSEGGADEPLFYPCKCSGSIKFVHQDCLMEWLSHTQKKYCELCKTPFRFTKLYDANMPKHIPPGVFMRRALLHFLSHMLGWCRALLVAFVWLVCLPWAMRAAWGMMFWFGDAGWARDRLVNDTSAVEWFQGQLRPNNSFLNHTTRPANYNSALTYSASLGSVSLTINVSSSDPLLARFGSTLFLGLMKALRYPRPVSLSNQNLSSSGEGFILASNQHSLLSEIPFLKELSPSPAFNRFFIDVLEGQIITLSVVVAFILIFLIREWVVQQQPVIDLAAAEGDNALAQAGGQANQQPADRNGVQEPFGQDVQGNTDGQFNDSAPNTSVNSDHESSDSDEESSIDGTILPRDVKSTACVVDGLDHTSENVKDMNGSTSATQHSATSSSSPLRPTMPSRERSFIATEIRRDLEEENLGTQSLDISEQPADPVHIDGRNSHGSTESWFHVKTPSREGSLRKGEVCAFIYDDILEWERKLIATQNVEASSPESSEEKSVFIPITKADSHHTEQKLTFTYKAEASGPPLDQLIIDLSSSESDQSDSHNDSTDEEVGAGNDPFPPDNVRHPFNEASERGHNHTAPQRDAPLRPKSMLEKLGDLFWGDIETPQATIDNNEDGNDDNHLVGNLADEPPFVHVIDGHPIVHAEAQAPQDDAAPVQGQEAAAAAAQAGIDAGNPLGDPDNVVDDAEDLEGIMELIGMQGPLVGLFQNALFSAFLIGATVTAAVILPYLWGKLTLLGISRPILIAQIPVQLVSAIVDFVAYIAFATVWSAVVLCVGIYDTLGSVFNLPLKEKASAFLVTAWESSDAAWPPPFNAILLGSPRPADLLFFSVESHAALHWIEAKVSVILKELSIILWDVVKSLSTNNWTPLAIPAPLQVQETFKDIVNEVQDFAAISFNYLLKGADLGITFDSSLANWSAADRALAVLAGYAWLAFAGALYVTRMAPIFTDPKLRRMEAILIDFLQQAGGVLKVIFIISIEMIVFPLFCGFLLDIALLPLFEQATLESRMNFTADAPWTSGFVHWFVGTCYMFHFALFVSMCRRIMRTGVLYFIRDPDDPTFHPVRDVLERSVTVQLRKIAFSAIVYGALIIICLGGVVWGLWYSSDSVLPIHWSSSESALEFPLDILFYNFLTPVVVRIARPSDGLQAMYKWWFRKCARVLRLSDFLFGEKNKDEEGRHVRRTWKAWIMAKKGDPDHPVIGEDRKILAEDRGMQVYFMFDGKHVRAPSSDQVRIPKGTPVFVEVDECNRRLDGKSDNDGVHAKDSVWTKTVYIPPWFKVRIGIFVMMVWVFAALTGVSITIIPLLLGRYLFSLLLPFDAKINDIYAFTLGIYILGIMLYLSMQIPKLINALHTALVPRPDAPMPTPIRAFLNMTISFATFLKQAAATIYVYSCTTILLPLLLSILIELYILMPIHAAFFSPNLSTNPNRTTLLIPTSPGTNSSTLSFSHTTTHPSNNASHEIHIIQDWTLGLLYLRLLSRIFLSRSNPRAPRLAQAARLVIRDGGRWRPDAWRATRYFVAPALLLFALLVVAPPVVTMWLQRGFAALFAGYGGVEERWVGVFVTRCSYPFTLALGAGLWVVSLVRAKFGGWVDVVRDEVYLVGERLHNYGERKARKTSRTAKGKERAVEPESQTEPVHANGRLEEMDGIDVWVT
jgi:E3 ubiquitin-protein ligase MARCH6